MSDTCPICGGPLEYDEVDVGVGTIRGNPGCPDCHWTLEDTRERHDDDGREYGHPDDARRGIE
jgi:hypothetical protein